MDYYNKGRKYKESRRKHIAKAFFEKGILRGCPKCAYGLFALKMSSGEEAQTEWEAFVNVFDDILKNAESGDADSCFIVGRSFETGCGGTYDMKKAIYWYRKAAKAGNIDAVFNLGCIYCYDENSMNPEKGKACFKLSAKHNLKEAQFNLARIYEEEGRGKDAEFWFRRALRGSGTEMKEKYMAIKSQNCDDN